MTNPAKAMSEKPISKTMLRFLLGEDALDGVQFGEKHPQHKGRFWWRQFLRREIHKAPAPEAFQNQVTCEEFTKKPNATEADSKGSTKFQDGICPDCESQDLCIQDNGCHNTGKIFSQVGRPVCEKADTVQTSEMDSSDTEAGQRSSGRAERSAQPK